MPQDPSGITHFETPEDFRAWMEAHHAERDELWVGFWKKATGRPSISWEESVDVALCYGWIDGIRKSIDENAYTIRFTPRRQGSVWSNRNMERYAAMLAEKLVTPPGAAAYTRRKEEKTGVYSFEQDVPPTLSAGFEARFRENEAAWADWEQRPPGYRKRATHWVLSAKRDATRERRFQAVVEACAAGRKVKPLRRKGDD